MRIVKLPCISSQRRIPVAFIIVANSGVVQGIRDAGTPCRVDLLGVALRREHAELNRGARIHFRRGYRGRMFLRLVGSASIFSIRVCISPPLGFFLKSSISSSTSADHADHW